MSFFVARVVGGNWAFRLVTGTSSYLYSPLPVINGRTVKEEKSTEKEKRNTVRVLRDSMMKRASLLLPGWWLPPGLLGRMG